MTKEEQIKELKAKMDGLMNEYLTEYEVLAERSEALYDEQESLKKEYEVLDAKTGLNALSAELTRLIESS